MLPRIEAQIERFAPGFRDCILERRVFSPAALEAMDANLIGGDIVGGTADLSQFMFRPTAQVLRHLGERYLYLLLIHASGGGVHGMCGYNAAKMALRRM